MKRAVLLAVGVAWAVMAAHALFRTLLGWPDAAGVWQGGMTRRLPAAFAQAEMRERIQGGDDKLGAFLAEARGKIGGVPRLVVLANDPDRNDLFQWYRSAFELFPARVWYFPAPGLKLGKKARLAAGPETTALVRDSGIVHLAYFNKPDPANHGWYALAVSPPGAAKQEMILNPMPRPVPRPADPPVSAVRWMGGLLLLLALGFALSVAAGLDRGFRDAPGARAGLAFLLGVTGTGWLMQALSLAGAKWSLPLILAAWAPVIAVAGWRVWADRAVPAVPVPESASFVSPPAWAKRAGLAGLGAGIALVFADAWIPMSAWGNWDAWAIWALKAKACWEAQGIPFGYLGEAQYKFSHPDYPNGLPAVQCFLGLLAGGLDERLLRFLSVGHFAAMLGLALVALRDLGAGEWRWLLAGGLALVPKLAGYAALGYGDVPVATWAVAGIAVLARAYAGAVPVWTVGLIGGLSTLTKDEALIWGAGCLLTVAAWSLLGKVTRRGAVAAAVVLVVLVAPWKLTLARLGIKPNDYVINPASMVAAVPARLPVVLHGYVLEAWGPGATMMGLAGRGEGGGPAAWYDHLVATFLVLWYAVPLCLLLGWAAFLAPPRRELLLPLALQVAGYTGVYFASNRDIAFHVVTTSDRVLLQLLPAAFVIAAAAAFAALPAPPPPLKTTPPGKGQKRKGVSA